MAKKRNQQDMVPRIRGTYNLSLAGVVADDIRTLILRRRLQVLVHSCVYYVFNENIVSDHTWSQWAKELADLQEKYSEIAKRVDYAEEFKGFDGSTGFHLPTRNPEIMNKAEYLLRLHKGGSYGHSGHKVDRAKPGSSVIRVSFS